LAFNRQFVSSSPDFNVKRNYVESLGSLYLSANGRFSSMPQPKLRIDVDLFFFLSIFSFQIKAEISNFGQALKEKIKRNGPE